MPEKNGLTREHHGELNIPREIFNGGKEAKIKRIAKLRREYAGDSLALEQIDVYDVDSEYGKHLIQYKQSMINGDINKINELEKWFEQYRLSHK